MLIEIRTTPDTKLEWRPVDVIWDHSDGTTETACGLVDDTGQAHLICRTRGNVTRIGTPEDFDA